MLPRKKMLRISVSLDDIYVRDTFDKRRFATEEKMKDRHKNDTNSAFDAKA
jgi:hypothetical protein